MTREHKKLKKEINNLRNAVHILKSTGDYEKLLDLSKSYKADRNRIHNEISHKYVNLFAFIQSNGVR